MSHKMCYDRKKVRGESCAKVKTKQAAAAKKEKCPYYFHLHSCRTGYHILIDLPVFQGSFLSAHGDKWIEGGGQDGGTG